MGCTAGYIELDMKKKLDPTELAMLHRKRRRRTCLTCCGACGILLILILLVIVILAFTIFKPKKPRIHVDSSVIKNFAGAVARIFPPIIKLNVTLGLVASVANPNKVSFEFYESTAHMFYRDVEVGIVPIPSREVGAGKTVQISSVLELRSDRLISNKHAYADFIKGSLPFSTRMDIPGRVNILNIFKYRIEMSSVCNMTISTTTKAIDNMMCS